MSTDRRGPSRDGDLVGVREKVGRGHQRESRQLARGRDGAADARDAGEDGAVGRVIHEMHGEVSASVQLVEELRAEQGLQIPQGAPSATNSCRMFTYSGARRKLVAGICSELSANRFDAVRAGT